MSIQKPEQSFRHIVFFKLHPEVDDLTCNEALTVLRALGQEAMGVQEWTVVESLDARKGRIIIENGLFENQAAFEQFRTSDAHGKASDFMRNIADWLVGDYIEG